MRPYRKPPLVEFNWFENDEASTLGFMRKKPPPHWDSIRWVWLVQNLSKGLWAVVAPEPLIFVTYSTRAEAKRAVEKFIMGV